MTVAAALRDAVERLRQAGVPDPARDANRLMAHVLGAGAGVAAYLQDELSAAAATQFEAAIAARCTRRPVSQIIGLREFWGRDFRVTPDVLDPRPETESLIAAALEGPAPAMIWDLGVGSGAILLTLLAEWPKARGLGADISDAALAVARENADRIAPGRAEFCRSDWFANLSGQADLIVSNPPYIAEAEMAALAPELAHEPRIALTPGGDGLSAYRSLAAGLCTHLAPGGRAFFEIGFEQGQAASEIFANAGFEARILQDLNGHDRVVAVC